MTMREKTYRAALSAYTDDFNVVRDRIGILEKGEISCLLALSFKMAADPEGTRKFLENELKDPLDILKELGTE